MFGKNKYKFKYRCGFVDDITSIFFEKFSDLHNKKKISNSDQARSV